MIWRPRRSSDTQAHITPSEVSGGRSVKLERGGELNLPTPATESFSNYFSASAVCNGYGIIIGLLNCISCFET